MRWLLRLQAFGSILVIGAFASAELSADLLQRFPGSELAWYVCLGVFGPFEAARSASSGLRFLFGPPSLAVACGLLLVTVLAYRAERRWALAALANLAFVSTALLAGSWFSRAPAIRSASLDGVQVALRADNLVVATLLVASFGAALLGHAVLLGWGGRGSSRA